MTRSWYQQFKRLPKEDRTYNKIVFDSKKEMLKYQDLLTMQFAGEIKNLKCQVQHQLILPNGVPIKTPSGRTSIYTADFEWDDVITGGHIIADVKGYQDPASCFRICVFEAISGKKVLIIK